METDLKFRPFRRLRPGLGRGVGDLSELFPPEGDPFAGRPSASSFRSALYGRRHLVGRPVDRHSLLLDGSGICLYRAFGHFARPARCQYGQPGIGGFLPEAGRIVLEIDPPETEIAVRRLRFYERLGFVRNDYHYVHPSFQRPYEPHQLVLMSYPKAMTDEECRSFERFVRDPVLSLFLSWKEGVIPLEYNQVIMETARRSKVFGLFYGDRMLPTRARSRRAMRPR